ncbi:amiloride-sensitive amine oxidase [copper-containing]-like [Dreissena polymorpha]|uniref:amiloride-sensitive amine oxidase [copper-containing]-like n=1 Tax=Dreissena polymorpha TaxID=45954 RepID=UPI002265385C|nr:amiloride-sensitive amine oxidase [copper-containing]-like [Dreissena polymorpha]
MRSSRDLNPVWKYSQPEAQALSWTRILSNISVHAPKAVSAVSPVSGFRQLNLLGEPFPPGLRKENAFGLSESSFTSNNSRKTKRFLLSKLANIILAGCIVALVVGIIFISNRKHESAAYEAEIAAAASNSYAILGRNLETPDVFDDLTPDEYSLVYGFLMHSEDLNLVIYARANISSNYVYLIELHIPPKDEVYRYWSGDANPPTREARVLIMRGQSVPPVIEEYIVTPADSPLTLRPTKNAFYVESPIPFAYKPIDKVEQKHLIQYELYQTLLALNSLLMDIFHMRYETNCFADVTCVQLAFYDNSSRHENTRYTWARLSRGTHERLIPIGLDVLLDQSSTSPADWSIKGILFRDAFYTSLFDLLRVYKSKYQGQHDPDANTSAETPEGERIFSPSGNSYPNYPDFTVKGQTLTYGQWMLTLHFSINNGLSVFDAMFNQERIVYEISLQKVKTLPDTFMEARGLFGASCRRLVPGIDCPETAAFLNFSAFVETDRPFLLLDKVCVFESFDPILHASQSGPFLVLRTVSATQNGEHVLDYVFKRNGEIIVQINSVSEEILIPELKTRPGTDTEEVGFNLFQFKVDIDSREETLASQLYMTGIKAETQSVVLDSTQTINFPRLSRFTKLVTNERCLPTNATTERPEFVIHNNSPSITYRITVDSNVNVAFLQKFATTHKWLNCPILVMRYSDSERNPGLFSLRDGAVTSPGEYGTHIDDENLREQDLQMWVTVGTQTVLSTSTGSQSLSASIRIIPNA